MKRQSLQDKIAAINARVNDRKTEGESVRAAFPLLSAEVDRLRATFGEVKVTYTQEGENRRSVPFEERFPVRLNADEFMRYVKTGEGWEGTCST